jgi:hypothetical protein
MIPNLHQLDKFFTSQWCKNNIKSVKTAVWIMALDLFPGYWYLTQHCLAMLADSETHSQL